MDGDRQTDIDENKSEVARLMRRLEMEYQAAQWAMTGLAAGSARHDFINKKLEDMGACHQQLTQLVGGPAAAKIYMEVTEKAGT